MNDFHNLSIFIEKKDKHAAMMVFRNKSEFAARKILKKIKVREIPGTGKIFWHNVQRWLLAACSQEIKPITPVTSSCSTVRVQNDIVESLKTAPGSGYPGWPSRKPAPGLSPSADVCAWPEGLPPVHAYMADWHAMSSQAYPSGSKTPAEKRLPPATRAPRHPAADRPQINGILSCSVPGSQTSLSGAGRDYERRSGVPHCKKVSTGWQNQRLNTGSCSLHYMITCRRRILSLAIPVSGQFYGKTNASRQLQHNGFARRQLNTLCGHREGLHYIPDQSPVHVAFRPVVIHVAAYLDRAYLLTRQDVDAHYRGGELSIQGVPPGMSGQRPERIQHDISGVRLRGETVCRHRYLCFTRDRGLHGCRQIQRPGRFLASGAARQGQAKKYHGAHTVFHFRYPLLWGIPQSEPEVSARCG